jgi:protein arginine N-methyltransferase 1
MSLVVDEHREYLSDTHRINAFQSAIRVVVRPGDVGLDLASGTGILGLLACQAGAARIYAIESGDIADIARRLAHENGFGDRISVINEHSTRVQLPEPVDFIVSDLAGRFGFEAGLFEILSDARRRFLKPGGALIPSAVSLWIAPVEASAVRPQVDFWSGSIAGLSFDAAHAIARATGYPRRFDVSDLLAGGARLAGADLSLDVQTLSGSAEFIVSRPGMLDGIGGWFTATLAPGVELTNAPGAPDRINRRNVFFPMHDSIQAQPGDRVSVSMFIRPASLIVRWRVQVHRDGALLHTTDTSTFKGMLLSREGLERSRPDFRPALNEAGRARRTVVDLCDGLRSNREIEREVYERHRQLFPTLDDATAFVAEVVTRYAI